MRNAEKVVSFLKLRHLLTSSNYSLLYKGEGEVIVSISH